MDKEYVRVIYTDGEYHLAPQNRSGKPASRVRFEIYQRVRELLNDLRADLKAEINPPKDKRMVVAKNHPTPVEEGEIIKFD